LLQEDLNAVEQDIPRAREELLKCGTQLAGVDLDIINVDLAEPLAQLFTKAWNAEKVVIMGQTVVDYLSEMRTLLEPYFFEKVATWALGAFVANYVVRLVNPENVVKVFGAKFSGGLGSRLKMTEERQKFIVADTLETRRCFAQFVTPEELTQLTQAMRCTSELLTNEADILITTLEAALRLHPGVSVESTCPRFVYYAFYAVVIRHGSYPHPPPLPLVQPSWCLRSASRCATTWTRPPRRA